MDPSPEERRLGDYALKEKLSEGMLITTWLAEQVSVKRMVLVDELDPERTSRSAAFLADIRAKASVDHTLIGTVYEAVIERNLCFYAHELLPGATLEDFKKNGETLMPVKLAHLLRRIAEANLHHEAHQHASSLLTLDAIHLDERVMRLKNLVIAGPRTPEQSVRDIARLGETLPALVAPNEAGTTRVLTLLAWMRGEGIAEALGWQDIHTFCEQIEHQLSEPLSTLSPGNSAAEMVRKKPVMLIAILTGLALVGMVLLAMKLKPPAPEAPPPAVLPKPVVIPAGTHLTPDGLEADIPAFKISAYEVTIGEYSEFLQSLEVLAPSGREKTFDDPGQPAEKTGHTPDDWVELFAAAKAKGTWEGRPVSLDSPVINVDWWDAAAYAEWKQARLPTQEEWFAAVSPGAEKTPVISPGNWQPVTDETPDRTATGLVGMAGSVSEWTRLPAANPNNPLGEMFFVIIGGSYLKPANGVLTREWAPNRSLRRPDLGFRIVSTPD